MANLSDAARKDIWAETMQEVSNSRESVGITKPELRAAVDAIDAWLNTNAATLNAAIPQPARGVLTAPQKARILTAVVRRRYIDGA